MKDQFITGESIGGVRFFTSPLLVEPGPPTWVRRSWRDRLLKPILHPFTVPFMPWVKMEKITPMVPMKKAIRTPQGYFMHPAMAAELRRLLQEQR